MKRPEILNRMTDYPVDIEGLMRQVPCPEVIRAGNCIRLSLPEVRLVSWRTDEEAENGVPFLREGSEWLLPEPLPETALSEGLVEAVFENETEKREYLYQMKGETPEILRIRFSRKAKPDIHYLIHYDTETFQYVHGNRSASYYLSDGLLIMD